MALLNEIPKTFDDAVKSLAEWHTEDDVTIYYLPDPAARVVRLVEVSGSFSDDNELRPGWGRLKNSHFDRVFCLYRKVIGTESKAETWHCLKDGTWLN